MRFIRLWRSRPKGARSTQATWLSESPAFTKAEARGRFNAKRRESGRRSSSALAFFATARRRARVRPPGVFRRCILTPPSSTLLSKCSILSLLFCHSPLLAAFRGAKRNGRNKAGRGYLRMWHQYCYVNYGGVCHENDRAAHTRRPSPRGLLLYFERLLCAKGGGRRLARTRRPGYNGRERSGRKQRTG
jgi:hypothetical protein